MSPRELLLSKVEAYLRATGLGSQKFGALAVGDTKLVRRLRGNGNLTFETSDKIEAFMRSNPPAEGKAA